MSIPNKLLHLTVDQYLAGEELSPQRREFVDGQVFVMSGATRRHNIIAGNIYSILRAHVRGSGCRAYMEAVKARVEAANCFYYPDVMVSCDSYDRKSVFTDSPLLIVEVLSPLTAAIDRREKRVNYMKIETLNELVLVHQGRQRVELYRRTGDGSWEISKFGPGEQLALESLSSGALFIPIAAIYEEVDFGNGDDGSLVWEETGDYEFDESDFAE